MAAWTDILTERAGVRGFSAGAEDVGYAGPADGDFARYVDQLMAQYQAEAQQRAAASAPAGARRTPPPGQAEPGQPRSRAAAPASRAGWKTLAWRKGLPWALWLAAAVAAFFWQAAAAWLVGLLIILGLVSQGLSGKKR